MYDKVNLEIVVENAAELANSQKTDPCAFALIRRNGYGASDSSVLLNVNPFNDIDTLNKQKASKEVTAEELAIGKKPTVRMGSELEPFILQKFIDWADDIEVSKPEAMYKVTEFPYITVNFDGIIKETGIPVEVKCVSMWAEKYWDHSKAMDILEEVPVPNRMPSDRYTTDYCKALATETGIPVYYYTQCQQQMFTANADLCYLAALHVKDWTLRVYPVHRNEIVINKLKEQAYLNWKKVERMKGFEN